MRVCRHCRFPLLGVVCWWCGHENRSDPTNQTRDRLMPDTEVVPALQRYVIAWAERKRAVRAAQDATATMAAEKRAAEDAVRYLPRRVELLDGSVYFAIHGERGIEISEAAPTTASEPKGIVRPPLT